MPAVYENVDWSTDASAFAAVDRLLSAVIGPVPGELLEQLRFRFEQAQYLEVPPTGFTPLMLHTLYGVAAIARPAVAVGCGTYAGVAFSLIAAGVADYVPGGVAIGADDDLDVVAMADRNAHAMGLQTVLRYPVRPAAELIDAAPGPIGLLFFDVDDPNYGKRDYALLAEWAEARLAGGAVMLAHDATVTRCMDHVRRLIDYIAGTGRYRTPVVLPVDKAGLSLAVRHAPPQSL